MDYICRWSGKLTNTNTYYNISTLFYEQKQLTVARVTRKQMTV